MPSDRIQFAQHPAVAREKKWQAVVQAHMKEGRSGAKKAFLKHFGPDSPEEYVPDQLLGNGGTTPKPPVQ